MSTWPQNRSRTNVRNNRKQHLFQFHHQRLALLYCILRTRSPGYGNFDPKKKKKKLHAGTKYLYNYCPLFRVSLTMVIQEASESGINTRWYTHRRENCSSVCCVSQTVSLPLRRKMMSVFLHKKTWYHSFIIERKRIPKRSKGSVTSDGRFLQNTHGCVQKNDSDANLEVL